MSPKNSFEIRISRAVIEFPLTDKPFAHESPFSPDDVLAGLQPSLVRSSGPGRIALTVNNQHAVLRFYGSERIGSDRTPVIYLAGDVVQHVVGKVIVRSDYRELSPEILQIEAGEIAARYNRTFVHLARPGIFGSSGHHLHRRRKHEIDLVNQAITRLAKGFSWNKIDLVGLSGGGHIVACLMARRNDIRRVVIASGNLAVKQRNADRGLTADVTGFDDFVDPIELVDQVAEHQPEQVTLLTDPDDTIVRARFQTAYATEMRAAGCRIKQKYVVSNENTHHILFREAIEEMFA